MKKITVCFLLTISAIHAQNPTYICNDCGVFDLSKVTFNENPDTLTSKLKTRRTVYIGKQLIEKWERDILPNDTIISFTISERGSSNKKRATYANLFEFNKIDILTDKNKKIIAYGSTNTYYGSFADIENFIKKIKISLRESKFDTWEMAFGGLVYQWHVDDKIIQIYRDTSPNETIEYRDNKIFKKRENWWIRINIYNSKLLNEEIKKIIYNKNVSFIFFTKKSYDKPNLKD